MDELIAEVAAQVVADARAHILPAIDAAPDAAGKLRAFIEANLGFIGANRDKLVALAEIQANARDADGGPLPDVAGERGAISGLERILRRGQDSGRFRDFSTHVMAWIAGWCVGTVAARMVIVRLWTATGGITPGVLLHMTLNVGGSYFPGYTAARSQAAFGAAMAALAVHD